MRKEEKRAVEDWVEFTQCGMGNEWNRRRDQREEKRMKRESEARQPDAGEGLPVKPFQVFNEFLGLSLDFGADRVGPMSTSRAGRL